MIRPSFASKAVAVLAAFAALAVIAAACSSGGGGRVAAVSPIVVNSELAVGQNRFMVGILGEDEEEIIGADVGFRFFKPGSEQPDSGSDVEATPIVLERNFTHTHEDGTVETHEAGESGVYVANVQFDEAGEWTVEVTAVIDGDEPDPADVQFTVLEESTTVAVGAPAPRSETLTLDDVADVAEIDTSDPPIPEMHTMTIAEAVTSGRPSVIVFATPAFCLSRICGPTKDVVDDMFEEYKDQVNFLHVEPYELDRARSGEGLFPIPATSEWGLTSEPWVFVVDEEGNVAAKFEAVLSPDELRGALTPLIAGAPVDAGSGTGYGY